MHQLNAVKNDCFILDSIVFQINFRNACHVMSHECHEWNICTQQILMQTG